MSIIKRFKDIMDANINSVISRAEEKNADKLLEKYLRDAKTNLANVKAETAAVIAEEKAAEQKLSACKANIDKYNSYAAAAVKAGNDNDARKFLTAKSELVPQLEILQKSYDMAKSNSEKMRCMTEKLTDDISKATQKMNELNSKLAVAKQMEKQAEFNEKINSGMNFGSIDGLFESVQKRIDKADALAELNNSKDDNELEELEKKYGAASAGVEEELAALKGGASDVDLELAALKKDIFADSNMPESDN